MRLKQEQIRRLAEKVFSDLDRERLVTPRDDKGAVIAGIAAVIANDADRERKLEQDAETLLDQTIAGLGKGAADIDRRKMLKMIKDKLARERRIVL